MNTSIQFFLDSINKCFGACGNLSSIRIQYLVLNKQFIECFEISFFFTISLKGFMITIILEVGDFNHIYSKFMKKYLEERDQSVIINDLSTKQDSQFYDIRIIRNSFLSYLGKKIDIPSKDIFGDFFILGKENQYSNLPFDKIGIETFSFKNKDYLKVLPRILDTILQNKNKINENI